jgi:hypothetical protein
MLNDEMLTLELQTYLKNEQLYRAGFLERLAEFDRRELFLQQGYSSLWKFCEKCLGLSKSSTSKRIVVAKLIQRFPKVLSMLKEGSTHLSALCIISRHLTESNHEELLSQIAHRSEDEVKRIIATLFPKSEEDFPCDKITWLTEDKGAVFFVAPAEVIEDLVTAQNLLKHKYPKSEYAAVFGEALKLLIEKRTPNKGKIERETKTPHIQKRHVRRRTKGEVWERDGGQCSYLSPDGHRCDERAGVEFDHVDSWALGGRSDRASDIRLLCFPHNRWLSRRMFGEKADYRRPPNDDPDRK